MVDAKLTALCTIAAILESDIIYIVDDPGGTPLSRKVDLDLLHSNIVTKINVDHNWDIGRDANLCFADPIGSLRFLAHDFCGALVPYASVMGSMELDTCGNEGGSLILSVLVCGVFRKRLTINDGNTKDYQFFGASGVEIVKIDESTGIGMWAGSTLGFNNVTADSATQRIAADSGGLTYIVPACDVHDFDITCTGTVVSIQAADMDFPDGYSLSWEGVASRSIQNNTGGFHYRVPNLDQHIFYVDSQIQFQINEDEVFLGIGTNFTTRASGADGFFDIDEITTPASAPSAHGRLYTKLVTDHAELFFIDELGTETNVLTGAPGEFTGAWTANHNNGGSAFALEDLLFADPTDDTKQIQTTLDGMTTGITAILDFNFTTAKTITFPDITGTVMLNLAEDTTPQLGADLDANGFDIQIDLTNVLSFNGATATNKIEGSAGGMDFEVPACDEFNFTIGGSGLRFEIGLCRVLVPTNYEFIWSSGCSRKIRNDACGFTFFVPSCDNFEYQINCVIEMQLCVTAMDLPNGAVFQEGGVPISPIGIHDISVAAEGMYVTTTLPACGPNQVELPTNDIDIFTMDFTSTCADERAQFNVPLPRNYNNGAITATVRWSHASGTGNVVWRLGALARGNSDAIDTAMTFSADLVASNDANNDMIVALTGSFTPGGTPADNDHMFFEIMRQGSDALDTFSGTARLHSITIHMTTDAATAA